MYLKSMLKMLMFIGILFVILGFLYGVVPLGLLIIGDTVSGMGLNPDSIPSPTITILNFGENGTPKVYLGFKLVSWTAIIIGSMLASAKIVDIMRPSS